MTQLKASLIGKYTVKNESRTHTWLADEPNEEGGDDKGPKPTEILLSALASCKLITLKLYADRKGWDLQNIHIDLKIIETGVVTKIEKRIVFIGDLVDKQKERLLDISGRCPVVKMLSNSIEFTLIDA